MLVPESAARQLVHQGTTLVPLLLALLLFACGGCDRSPAGARSSIRLTEVTAELGLDASPPVWPDGTYRIPELSAGAVALFDADGDGDLDVYQVVYPPPGSPAAPAPNRLFEQRDGRLVDVSAASGLADPGYGNGVAVGDIDNDGDDDVFVANLQDDALYRNEGGGRFTEVTATAGIQGKAWSTCAAFFDFDRDGWLDLYVARYVVDDPTRVCQVSREEPQDYCGPHRYQGVTDVLYRNVGGGRFADVTGQAGIGQARPGFGVVCLDLTGDGWSDVYVANDMKANQLWVNQRNGTFRDEALERGVALNGAGSAEAGMGVAVGDVDGNGHLDLFVTHLVQQTNTLYLAGGAGAESSGALFSDRSGSSGLGAPSLPRTAWGCGFVDLDHDADLDLAIANGRIARAPPFQQAVLGAFWNDYAEPDQIFEGSGDGTFSEVDAGDFARRIECSRALAVGDIDGDGDVDAVVAALGNRLRIFRNDSATDGFHWLRVRCLTSGRDALSAIVTVSAGDLRIVRPILSTSSFAAASEAVAHFGLGRAARVDRISVAWPDGSREAFPGGEVDRTVICTQGASTKP